MNTLVNFGKAIFTIMLMGLVFGASAQTTIANFRANDQEGVNVFETPKETDAEFDGLKVKVGGHFTQQFQALDHENNPVFDDQGELLNGLYAMKPGFNLATANLNLDVQLYEGVRLHLVTYLSSRHHPEAWVKGGYIQFDELTFLNSSFFDNIMEKVTIKVGHMEINYGDTHFRRTDNGNAIYNPFIGNYIMDAFNTEIGAEVYYQNNGVIGMLGLTGGEINGNIAELSESENDDIAKRSPSIIGKLGYDSQINDDFRLRVTGSVYYTASSAANHLFDGDRGGSRYYLVMSPPGVSAGDRGIFSSGRYNPGFSDEVTSAVGNVFLKYKGAELFGFYETATGKSSSEADTRSVDQIGADLLYRFGKKENVYVGARYNVLSGEDSSGEDISINRYQLGAGWFLTPNVLAKLEYVNQEYKDFPTGSLLDGGSFNGIMFEAVVGF